MSVARQVSLPDLVTEKRRNTAMSLSEGFPGFERKPALAATALGFKPFTGGSEDSSAKLALAKILPVYYRTRQFVLSTEKSGLRIPRKLQQDLKNQEQAVASHLRSLHPLFFPAIRRIATRSPSAGNAIPETFAGPLHFWWRE
jgi:hypothetical protein